jgi:RNA polymerase sigma-70 factor (ECF subfamily)
MITPAEQFLIESIKKGDKKAFEFLFNKYYADMWKYARSMIRDEATAEDLVMDIFVMFWETAKTIDIKTSIAGYLCRCVHNHCINFITRKHKRFPGLKQETIGKLDSMITTAISDNPFEGFCFLELHSKIEASIDRLPDECRRIFLMSRSEELSHDEIAKRLNISKNTVKVQIYRALLKLHEILKEFGDKV